MYEVIDHVLNVQMGLGVPGWVIHLVRHVTVAGILLVIAPLQMLLLTYLERRIIARMQDRVGPNRVGPEGLFQPVADGIKMFTKEDIVPTASDRWVHLLAPCVVVAPVFLMVSVVPWGPELVPIDMNLGLLFFFAVSSVSGAGLLMAGWGSNNKFSLLGGMRAAAQMVAYEIPAVLSILAIVIVTGTLSLVKILNVQGGLFTSLNDVSSVPNLGLGWFVFTPVGFLAFLCFFISALAEGERTPFDIPEADSEIVAGYMTEYSGMKFGLFYLAQYVLNFLLCAITAILFFGGWQGPGVEWLHSRGVTASPDGSVVFTILANVLGLAYFLAKTYFFFFVMVWLRGAFPRLRIDQLLDFCWKFLIPLTLVNVVSATLWAIAIQWGSPQGLAFLEGMGEWARWGMAFALTLVINAAAYIGLVRVNETSGNQTTVAEDRQDRSMKTATLS
ncbi:MAG: NADH-quinone oxidoreductase subunit NuoH [Chloroflexaceae bacterium]|nr:NADH-quinone oxidoreductase subunit NuoH [Chloroflexaceae bacterium]